MRREYEEALKAWLDGDKSTDVLKKCCMRKELYYHEACHLIAIIRAFPSERTSLAHTDFLEKIENKFAASLETATDAKRVPFGAEYDRYAFPLAKYLHYLYTIKTAIAGAHGNLKVAYLCGVL